MLGSAAQHGAVCLGVGRRRVGATHQPAQLRGGGRGRDRGGQACAMQNHQPQVPESRLLPRAQVPPQVMRQRKRQNESHKNCRSDPIVCKMGGWGNQPPSRPINCPPEGSCCATTPHAQSMSPPGPARQTNQKPCPCPSCPSSSCPCPSPPPPSQTHVHQTNQTIHTGRGWAGRGWAVWWWCCFSQRG